MSRVHAYCSPSSPTASRSSADHAAGRRQPTHGRVSTSAPRRPSRRALRGWREIRGRAIARTPSATDSLTQQVGSGEFAEGPVEVAPVPWRPSHSVWHGARFGERRAFAGVVAPLEFAVGALEVVLVEAAVDTSIRPSSPISTTCRTDVSFPASSDAATRSKQQALTANGQRAPVRTGCTARETRSTAARIAVRPSIGVTAESSPIVVHEPIRVEPRRHASTSWACMARHATSTLSLARLVTASRLVVAATRSSA